MKDLIILAFYQIVDSEYKWAIDLGYTVDETLTDEEASVFIDDIKQGYHLGVYLDDVYNTIQPCIRG